MFGKTLNGLPEWQSNPEIFALNRLPHHADFTRYATYQEALQCKRWNGERYQSLNGNWLFYMAENPSGIPVGFWEDEADLTGFIPMLISASTSTAAFMEPISAAKAEPLLPENIMAVIIGPSSLVIETPTRFAT